MAYSQRRYKKGAWRVQADKAAVAGDNVVVADTADWDMVALEGRAYQVAEDTEKEKSRFIHSC